MQFLVPFALFGWIPVVFGLFLLLPPRRAVLAAFLLAWLFLPMAGYTIAGLPDYTKMSATCVGVLLAAAVFDAERLLSFRLRWFDIPVLVFCFSPFVTSLANGLGAYDGMSMTVRQVFVWGLPYVIGRVYFTDPDGVRELAMAMVIGGMIYVPLCLWEIRMSPQLHHTIYGYKQHSFHQQMRMGGYRPMVFMQHGLMVAMWMTMTSLLALWMWRAKSFRAVYTVPAWLIVPGMLLTALLCKSMFTWLLLAAGLAALYGSLMLRSRVLVYGLLCVAPVFMFVRATGIVDGEGMVEWVRQNLGDERASSLNVRVTNENALSEHALKRPIWGWGGWGRARIKDDATGQDTSTTDSLWIITLGNAGIVGLAALTAMLLLPMVLVMRDYRPDLWMHPKVAPIAALGVVVALYMLDHLMNGMVNPIFMLGVGALGSVHAWAIQAKRVVPERVEWTGGAAAAPAYGAALQRQRPMVTPW